jgi:predicted O-linked N-acetylglucosamine transferase (SPINDLY family)
VRVAKVNKLAARPRQASADALLEQAHDLHRRGSLPAAATLYRRVLEMQPRNVDAMQLLGVVEFQSGRFGVAADLLQKAVGLAPGEAPLYGNLGLALQQLGRPAEALACQERALALKPDLVEAHNNRGNALRELGRPVEAADSYADAIRLRPDFGEAHYNLGCLQLERKRPREALESLAHCLRSTPHHPGALAQSGMALLALHDPLKAVGFFERALQLRPDDAEAHYWRGNALLALGRNADAAASYRRTAQLRPDIAEGHYNLGNALLELGRHDEALPAYDRALAIRPGFVEALYNRAGLLQEQARYEEAVAGYRRVMDIAPDHRYALGKLFHSRQFCCAWNHYAEDVRALCQSAAGARTLDMPFPFLAVVDDPALQLRCARDFTQAKYPAAALPASRSRIGDRRRIRLAYVSGDFREHALSYLLAGVFESHDRDRFDTVAISLRPRDAGATGARVAAAFGHFVDASAMTDGQVAGVMRDMDIDIAVDLAGYTEDNRTGIFALRPAPLQVNYLGFPGGMGADFIDYLIADDYVIPEQARQHYAEQIVRLPHCFQGNDGKRAIAGHGPGRAEAGLPEAGFVFCAFNNLHKLNPVMFDIWMRLLRAVPGSVLWLAVDSPLARHNLATEAVRRGVDASRLVFARRVAYAEHLARMGLADLFLDTLPFNAGTTASDALWAGLPVLTCSGHSFAARMAGSLLRAVGLPELITDRLDDYEARALELATTPGLLNEMRARLERNRRSAPLFDTDLFCRHLEAAYETMWERHQRGEAPAGFAVPAIPG